MNILDRIALAYVQSILKDIYVNLESKKHEINDALDSFGPRRHTDNNYQKEAS